MRQYVWTIMVVPIVALSVTVAAAGPKNGKDTAVEARPHEDFCGLCEARENLNTAYTWLKVGADFRARAIYQEDTTLLRHGARTARRSWQRFRTRVWATVTPVRNLDFNVRLVNEFRNYAEPKGGVGGYSRHLQPDEILFDTFNIKVSNPLDKPIVITAGRQDIILGDGWLVLEGTPLDGSRTIYFDAVRGTIDMPSYKSTLDLIYIDQAADTDRFIKPISDQRRVVTNQDERAAIIYLTNKSLENTQIDGYFIYKHDMAITEGSRTAVSGGTSSAEIYTFGVRVAGDLNDRWRYRAEVAPQFGAKNGQTINALGGTARVTYKVGDAVSSELFADYEYRSGGKNPNQNFDILWGRYPQWSNAYGTYVSTLEGPPEMSSNLHRAGIGWKMSPMKDMTITTAYNALFADNNNQPRIVGGTPSFSKGGRFRGHVFSNVIKHKINEHLKQHLTTELFVPGNYYSEGRNDPAVFARYEILFTW